jgi:hypothetical protein
MSGIIDPLRIGRAMLAIAVAVLVLVLTAFMDAGPTRAPDVGWPATFDVPAGGRWCVPQDEAGTGGCRFQTFEHCLAVVGTYATCRPNPSAVAITDEGPYRIYHSLTRAEHNVTLAN